ncbi:MAG: hypothetical protein AAGI37_17880 [Planctomycetota bacterium]
MAINGASTLADIKGQYLDNVDYEETASLSKARLFVSACRALLLKLPANTAGARGGAVAMSPGLIRDEMNQARAWISANNTNRNSGVKHLSLEGFRR